MFMRYRGGGIGHKYMREIEEKYENMSRECLHGKQRPKPPADNTDADDASDADDEPEDLTQLGTLQAGQVDEPVSRGLGGDADGDNSDESDDVDYQPPGTHSSGSDEDQVIDSDEMGSDFGYKSYGLGDL